ncbi:ribosome small subunit-dependent GTPase A [Arenimonas sp.]|uniref:ribosome small subunit-dependent GTPase A n=1 Tax=Arenimonas sp. TaxID=1872635 RepID=UPI002E327E61|nr:ribosome small subunit-dependent GTPase A [Arenimonas sp.]HEX4852876.1 ribosome small subunit-dependent GTPase A [Arenimonas sp.]
MQPTPEALDLLRPIGWPDGDAYREALAAAPGARLARVVGQHRSAYDVATRADEVIKVQPPLPWTRPRCPPEQRAAVGDWVTLDEAGKNILALLPRHALLKRGAAGEHHRQQLIAANVDHVLVVVGLDQDFNPRRIERYLVVIRASGADPVLVLTKADECEIVEDCIDLLMEVEESGVPIHAVNAKDPASVAVLAPYLGPGQTVVLVGSSGAGKSTLTNTLLGREKMKTNAVRGNDSRGRHTTTFRVLTPLPQGGCLIDTPGMREVKLSGDEDIVDAFEDIEALGAGCRFRDCVHGNEPGCAVRAAIEDGTLDEARYLNYVKLRDEAEAAAVTQAARRAEEALALKNKQRRTKDKLGRR